MLSKILLVTCLLLCGSIAYATVVDVTPTKITNDDFLYAYVGGEDFLNCGDYIMTYTNFSILTVLKMETNGSLLNLTSWDIGSRVVNGFLCTTEWFGWWDLAAHLFQLNKENGIVNYRIIPRDGVSMHYMLPDNTLLRYISQDNIIETLIHNPLSDDWDLLEQTLPIPYQTLYSFYADENNLIYGNEGNNFTVYERTMDSGWSLSTNIEVNTTSVCYAIIHNRKYALFFVYADRYGNDLKSGFILVYTKIAEEWIQTQVITADELPLSPEVNGITSQLANDVINPDLIILGNPYDVAGSRKRLTTPIGSVLFFQRQGDGITWELIAKTRVDQVGYFGIAAMATSNYIVIPFGDATKADDIAQTMPESFYSIPICLFDPVNVTCHHIETSNSCGDIVDFMNGQGYTINSDQSQCGEISAMIVDSTYQNNTSTLNYTVTFGFDKTFASTSCNATLTCNALASSTPTGSNYPIPDLPSDPNGNLAPSKKTSDAPISSVSLKNTILVLLIAIVSF